MYEINVQFEDESQGIVVSYFLGPQDPQLIPNVGTVKSDDPRWKAFYDGISGFIRQSLPSPA
ncbi:hypothetical protein A9975_15570 [Cupriavidus sp. UME77]|nr:hypothetical protein [Cupriavidus sp. UME77]